MVNTPALIKLLGEATSIENTIMCRVWKSSLVQRNKSSKFYQSEKEYPDNYYPTYCDGPAYLMTTDLTLKLLNASFKTKKFKFEDIYVGILAKDLGLVKFVDLSSRYFTDFEHHIDASSFNLLHRAFLFLYPVNLQDFKDSNQWFSLFVEIPFFFRYINELFILILEWPFLFFIVFFALILGLYFNE